MLYWTGARLKHGLLRMLRDEALAGAHTEFYQLSKGLEVEYDQPTHSFLKCNFEGEPIEEALQNGQHQNAKGTGRLIMHLNDGTVVGEAEE